MVRYPNIKICATEVKYRFLLLTSVAYPRAPEHVLLLVLLVGVEYTTDILQHFCSGYYIYYRVYHIYCLKGGV